jgi:hypothetical protein
MRTFTYPNIRQSLPLLLFLLMMMLLACKNSQVILPQNDTAAGELPLLRGKQKIGTIVGFNPSHPAATTDSIAARWQEAIDKGMSIARLQIDWPELEPRPGGV